MTKQSGKMPEKRGKPGQMPTVADELASGKKKHADKNMKICGESPYDDAYFLPTNPGQVLTVSGQITKQSGKVPKKCGQMPTQSAGQEVEKYSKGNMTGHCAGKKKHSAGKVPNDASYSWLENHWQKMLGKEYHGQLKKFIEGIRKKQCLLEAVFYPQNSEKNIYSDEKELKIFKNRWEEIDQNDPALSQLLERLFAVVMKANEAIKKGNTLSMRKNELKQSLAYAVFFVAKRRQIPLESPRGEKENEPKAILIELITIYDELQLDDVTAIESCRKCGKRGKEEKGQKGKEKRKEEKQEKERRFLQFVARSLEIEWDANAFSGGPEEENEDDAIGRRRRRRRQRRRKRMNNNNNSPAPAPTADADDDSFIIFYYLIFLAVLHVVVVLYFCCSICVFPRLPSENVLRMRARNLFRMSARSVVVVPPHPQEIQLVRNAGTDRIISTPYDGTENIECQICLGEIKKMGKEEVNEVIKLECNHIFHFECISKWFENSHKTCPYCRLVHANTVLLNDAIQRGETAHGTAAVANPQQELVIYVPPADGQNGGNAMGSNRHNNGTANAPN